MFPFNKFLPFLFLLISFLVAHSACAQVEKGGTPRSFSRKDYLRPAVSLSVAPPDMNAVNEEDIRDAGLEKPYRVGVSVPLSLNTGNSGLWENLADGGRLWILGLKCSGAQAIGIDYRHFYLPPGSDLFIYNNVHSVIAGAFTPVNNPGERSFSTRPVRGDEIVLEYYQPAGCFEQPILDILGLVFMYRGIDVGINRSGKNFGGSGACEVNVNCQEGDAWKQQAQGVIRLLARVRGNSFWCTGSLLNNTRLDFSPLCLTANHCSQSAGLISSADDLDKWIFYFNYESESCADPASEPVIHSLIGATKLASSQSPSGLGSDFFLVKLNQNIPAPYLPYYNGWNNLDNGSPSGVGIHHPQGDIKKISTYKTPLTSGTYETTVGTHWIVQWSSTPNGFGITEPGSSGSPVFDNNGLLIGTLTGGESSCKDTAGLDYYGKVAYSWQSNGIADSMQLKPWLDPLNEGRSAMQGAFNDRLAIADFEADTTSVPIGGELDFFDRSMGNPVSWHWYFQGGEPSESTQQSPVNIVYKSFGKYSVKLIVNNQYGTDSLTKISYVEVKAVVYPNPTNGAVTIFLDPKSTSGLKFEIFNEMGLLVKTVEWNSFSGSSVSLDMPRAGNIFFLRMQRDSQVQIHKIIVVGKNP